MASVVPIEEEEIADAGEKENKNEADKQKPKVLSSTKDGIPTHIAFGKRVPVPTPVQTSRSVQSKTPRTITSRPSKEDLFADTIVSPVTPSFLKMKSRNEIVSSPAPVFRSKLNQPLVSLSSNLSDRITKQSLRYSSEKSSEIDEEIEYHPDIEESTSVEEETKPDTSLEPEESAEPPTLEKSASIVKLKVEEVAKHKSRLSTLLESAKNSARNWRVEHKDHHLNDDVVFDESLHTEDGSDTGSDEAYYIHKSKPSSLRNSSNGISTDSPRVSRNIKTQGTDQISFEEFNEVGAIERRPVTVNVSVNLGSSPTGRDGFEDDQAYIPEYDDDEEDDVEYYDQHEDYTPEVFSHHENDEDSYEEYN